MFAINTRELTKVYGRARGITELTLEVPMGGVFGFIGPNGAGKSTTIRTLLGLISPTSGAAEVLGMDVKSRSREILARVGYMPGEMNFYPGMRAGEIAALSARLRGRNCSAEAARLADRLDIDMRRKADELSLGNRKKLGILCAMQHRPDLYIFDEPTSGLDPLIQKEFFSLIGEREAEGATVFLSSHVLSEVQRHCARAAVIREGRLVACDTVERLAHTSARRVSLQGVSAPPDIPGVKDARAQFGGVSFLYQGDIKALISALNGLNITDINITEPDLDEVFMHFYEGGDAV